MVALASQSRDGKSSSAIPRLPDGRPDLNGVWDHPFVQNMEMDGRDQKGAGPLPFTPEGPSFFKSFVAAINDNKERSFPPALTRSIISPFPFKFFRPTRTEVFS